MNPIARAALLLFLVLGTSGAAHAVTVITTMPNTSTWVTFYQAGASWVGVQANSGCIVGGKGDLHVKISASEYYIRTEVMASNDCKGTKICDTRMRASMRTSPLYVNQSARDSKNCFISEKDQSGEAYVGPGLAACIASLPALGGQVDAAFAKARAASQIDAGEVARYQSARATTGKSVALAPLRLVSLAQCRNEAGELHQLQRVVSSMSTPLPGTAMRFNLGFSGSEASALAGCESRERSSEYQLTQSHIAASSEHRLGRIGEAEFAALRANLETVWKDRVARHGGTSKLYACEERINLISDLQARLRMLAY